MIYDTDKIFFTDFTWCGPYRVSKISFLFERNINVVKYKIKKNWKRNFYWQLLSNDSNILLFNRIKKQKRILIDRRNHTYPNCELYLVSHLPLKIGQLCFVTVLFIKMTIWIFMKEKGRKNDRWNVHALLKTWYRIFSDVGACVPKKWYKRFYNIKKRHILILILSYEKMNYREEKQNSIRSTLVVKYIYYPGKIIYKKNSL
jgi:hypothetical protein